MQTQARTVEFKTRDIAIDMLGLAGRAVAAGIVISIGAVAIVVAMVTVAG